MTPQLFRLSPTEPPGGGRDQDPPFDGSDVAHEGEELPFRVEIWDESGAHVELVVAVSLSPAIGYAAFYAATREYPGRPITLRHKGRVLSRWTAQTH